MNYRKINNDRQFKEATGYSRAYFVKLLADYKTNYKSIKGQEYEDYIRENVTETPKLKTLGDALFFVLFQMKNDLVLGALGAVFNMSGSAASKNFDYFSNLLEQTLKKKSNASSKI